MRSILLAAVVAAVGAPAAAAAPQPGASPAASPLLIECSRDAQFQRALRREHGRLVYVTAAEVLAARRAKANMEGPRCISGLEAWRLERALARDARMVRRMALAGR